MFILTTIEDVIAIEPKDFGKTSVIALENNINEKYANKITQEVGLFICFYDLLEASDGLIGHGEGKVHVQAKFRMIVFRPFKGEILEGRILKATQAGMHITMDFFSDVFIPEAYLFPDCKFDANESVWVWTNEGADLYFDRNERIRFRVEEEVWTDLAPGDEPPKLSASVNEPALPPPPPGSRHQVVEGEMGRVEDLLVKSKTNDEEKRALRAWKITGSMSQGGLGLINWW